MNRKNIRSGGASRAKCNMVGGTHKKRALLLMMSIVEIIKSSVIKKFYGKFVFKKTLNQEPMTKQVLLLTLIYFLYMVPASNLRVLISQCLQPELWFS
jgi:hypothetical protein